MPRRTAPAPRASALPRAPSWRQFPTSAARPHRPGPRPPAARRLARRTHPAEVRAPAGRARRERSRGPPGTRPRRRRAGPARRPPPVPPGRRCASASPQSRPSTAARATVAGVHVSRVRPCSEAGGVRAVGRALALEVRDAAPRPPAPGGRRQGEVGEARVVDAEQPRGGVEDPRGVEGARPAAGSGPVASAKPATMPDGSAAGDLGDGARDAGGADRDDDVAGRRRPDRARRRRCRRCPAPSSSACRSPLPARLVGGPSTARQHGVVAEGEPSRSRRYSPVAGDQ